MFRLDGQFALVTGSTAGIGKAIAKAFLDAGATVFVNGRSQERTADVVAEFNDSESKEATSAGVAIAAVGDVSTAEGTALVEKIVYEKAGDNGALDILVCNVGIFGVRDFFDVTDDEWLHYFQTNVMSTVIPTRVFMEAMLERKSGRVIVISSECGVRGFSRMPQYAMTKTAQLGLVRSLSALTKGTEVTVNAILPGPTWTKGVEQYMKEVAASKGISSDEAIQSYFKENEPTSLLQRFLYAEEIAAATLYLCSKNGLGTNGASMRVDGGIIRSI